MRNVLVVLYVGILMSCAGEKIPKQIIPIPNMSMIMWDLMKMDEYYIRLTAKDSLNKLTKENIRLYEQVFKTYGISRKKFYDSYAYYESHPAQYKILVDSVESISTKQKKILDQKTQSGK